MVALFFPVAFILINIVWFLALLKAYKLEGGLRLFIIHFFVSVFVASLLSGVFFMLRAVTPSDNPLAGIGYLLESIGIGGFIHFVWSIYFYRQARKMQSQGQPKQPYQDDILDDI